MQCTYCITRPRILGIVRSAVVSHDTWRLFDSWGFRRWTFGSDACWTSSRGRSAVATPKLGILGHAKATMARRRACSLAISSFSVHNCQRDILLYTMIPLLYCCALYCLTVLMLLLILYYYCLPGIYDNIQPCFLASAVCWHNSEA